MTLLVADLNQQTTDLASLPDAERALPTTPLELVARGDRTIGVPARECVARDDKPPKDETVSTVGRTPSDTGTTIGTISTPRNEDG